MQCQNRTLDEFQDWLDAVREFCYSLDAVSKTWLKEQFDAGESAEVVGAFLQERLNEYYSGLGV